MMRKSEPLDPKEVLFAWKELPDSDKGISVREALRFARKFPEQCPRLLAVLAKTGKHHRSNALENALDRAIWEDNTWDRPGIQVVERTPLKIRKLRKNAKRRYRTRTPDQYLANPVRTYIIK